MANPWERPGALERLAGDMSQVASAYRNDGVAMNDAQRWALLVAAAELAHEMTQDLIPANTYAGTDCEVGC